MDPPDFRLATLDWLIVGVVLGITLLVGLLVARRSARSADQYFLSGRTLPWWLLGISMVATTFSTDTPNLVTQIVRAHGVAGNWQWWAFLLTGMLTVFVYAQLWRRSGVTTDLEFYELRYGGAPAAVLRGFRAIYLGVFFNVCIMAGVSLAAIKIAAVLFGFSALTTLLVASAVTVIFSAAGGFRAVVLTDLLLFGLAMVGAIGAAVVAINLPQVGGLDALLAHPDVAGKLAILPPLWSGAGAAAQLNLAEWVPLLIMPLAVQWWAVWYPGSEPGGGGYVAQRMLSARNERHAVAATFLFQAAHYALRPWPWILVALASLVVFPDLESLRQRFPQAGHAVGHDLAYPAMLTFLPGGLLGVVVASLIAAYMSTISTHLNWGASYVVNDFWRRFVNPAASEREAVWVGRTATVALMVLAGLLAISLEDALEAFQILLQIGAGTGLLFLLRWFWWRINAWSELTAMLVSFAVAVGLKLGGDHWLPLGWQQLLFGVTVTTLAWVLVTLLTPPERHETLVRFCRLIRPGGPGWRPVLAAARDGGAPLDAAGRWNVPAGLLAMLLGCLVVYAALFGVGALLYGRPLAAGLAGLLVVGGSVGLVPAARRALGAGAA